MIALLDFVFPQFFDALWRAHGGELMQKDLQGNHWNWVINAIG